jgi:hypothetical protein
VTGTWRTVGRGWPAFAAAVLGNAAVQALTVLPGVTPAWTTSFLALFLASFAAIVLAAAVVAATAAAVRPVWPRGTLIAVVALLVLAVAGLSLLTTYVIPVAVAGGAWWLGVVAGRHRPGAAFRVFRDRPVAAVLAVLVTILLVVIGWVAAFGLGFFVTGWLSALLTWIIFGVVGVVLIAWWAGLYRSE